MTAVLWGCARGTASLGLVQALLDIDIAGHPVSSFVLGVLLAFLLVWVGIYVVYKITWRPDFGIPVRRRLLCSHLKVQRDQVAYVPLWWSNLQVQRAIKSHWRESLRSAFPQSHAAAHR